MTLPASFPDLAALDLFRSVMELGSLTKAAQAHFITQPSASSRIRTLEAQLGVTLLERSPTGSQPTAEGQMIAVWAATILDAADDLVAGVAAMSADRSGLLRIAASYTVAEYLLPPWLGSFLDDRQSDSVTLEVTNSRAVVERLDAGHVDLGFIESPTVPSTLAHQVVATDDLIVVVAARHEWAAQGVVEIATFCSTPLVQRERGSGTRDALERELARMGRDAPPSALDLGSISAVRIAVINGSSPTVISRLAVRADLEAGTLVEVSVPGLQIERQLRAVWPRHADLARLASELLAHLSALSSAGQAGVSSRAAT